MKERLPMNHPPLDDDGMPAEIDFSKGVRGLHHIPPDAKVLMPAAAEVRFSVTTFFSSIFIHLQRIAWTTSVIL